MLARTHRGQRRLKMRTARGGHAHDVDFRARHQFFDLGGGKRHTVLLRKRARILRIARRNAQQSAALGVRDGLRMEVGNHAHAHNAKTQRRGGSGRHERTTLRAARARGKLKDPVGGRDPAAASPLNR